MRDEALRRDLLERFCRYVRIDTTADPTSDRSPSSPGQEQVLELLEAELSELGWGEVERVGRKYLIARIPATAGGDALALLAHVDTSPDAPGHGVQPLLHENYGGGPLRLPAGQVLDPNADPYLSRWVGDTLITSDGTTLLGADDKAGVAVLMSFIRWLTEHPNHPRPELELVFTTDEEIGRGVENFPLERLRARRGLTLDGGEAGELEDECYDAYLAEVCFHGVSHHPGTARGRLANAAAMAAQLVASLPRSESPEATDGRYGCLWVSSLQGTVEEARVAIQVRDFEEEPCRRRLELVRTAARLTELSFPGGRAEVQVRRLYRNMKPALAREALFLALVEQAIRDAGLEPRRTFIRGGTDGARLTEMGLACPNLFAGGANFHSRTEYVPLGAMEAAVRVLSGLVALLVGGERI